MSNVSVGSQGPVWFSVQRSGIMNGFTHVIALAGEASAVATAPTSTVLMPTMGPRNVATGFPRLVVLNTFTRTWSIAGNVTSAGITDTFTLITRFCDAVEAAMAFRFAAPLAVRSLKSSNTSAVAPASAPESAEA